MNHKGNLRAGKTRSADILIHNGEVESSSLNAASRRHCQNELVRGTRPRQVRLLWMGIDWQKLTRPWQLVLLQVGMNKLMNGKIPYCHASIRWLACFIKEKAFALPVEFPCILSAGLLNIVLLGFISSLFAIGYAAQGGTDFHRVWQRRCKVKQSIMEV